MGRESFIKKESEPPIFRKVRLKNYPLELLQQKSSFTVKYSHNFEFFSCKGVHVDEVFVRPLRPVKLVGQSFAPTFGGNECEAAASNLQMFVWIFGM